MRAADVMGMIRREMEPLCRLAELVHDVAWNDAGGGRGKGLLDHVVAGDHVGMWGFFSRPPDGGDAVAMKVGGAAGFTVLLGFRHRTYQLSLKKGSVGIRDVDGLLIKLEEGVVTIDASAKVGANIQVLTGATGITTIKGGKVCVGGATGISPFNLALNQQTLDPITGAPLQAVGNSKAFVGDVG